MLSNLYHLGEDIWECWYVIYLHVWPLSLAKSLNTLKSKFCSHSPLCHPWMSAHKSNFISISSFSKGSNECGTNNYTHFEEPGYHFLLQAETILIFGGHRKHSRKEMKTSLEATVCIPGKVLTLCRPQWWEVGTNSSFTANWV